MPQRSESYLEFVRGFACCICSAPPRSDPHHFGPRGFGQKTSDFRTVPLCRKCHDEWHHNHSVYPFDRRGVECKFYQTQIWLLETWIAKLSDSSKSG